ncbi:MAG: ATP-binding cassette domain-containing protein [Pseudomonadota bacterium]
MIQPSSTNGQIATGPHGQSGLHLANVEISLAGTQLMALDARVEPGRVFTVMGPSGSGKSSLLNLIGGFLPPAFSASGDVLLDGSSLLSLAPHQRRVGTLFQDALLFPHMSVGGNMVFAIPSSVRGANRRHRAQEALASIGMSDFFDRDPSTLSGGQRSRVALARLLLAEPKALLLDEPFSKLDAALRGSMRDLVFSAAAERQLPVVLVTHDEADADAAGGPVFRV